jgi:hypothetical protein
LRGVAVAVPIMLVITFVSGAQFYYPLGLIVVVFAIGWEPVAARIGGASWRRPMAIALIALNALVSATLGLPVVPVTTLGDSPIPSINQAARDSVGWPRYVEQVARVYRTAPAGSVVVTSNYGEAGAIARYGPDIGIDAVYSGHNALYWQAEPPAEATSVVFVGGQYRTVEPSFSRCEVKDRLDNGVGVETEEQGQPIAVCTGRSAEWTVLWPQLQHFD